jgi:hypothetical protein
MKIVAIIQARWDSCWLPGEARMDMTGHPIFSRVVQRARQARILTEGPGSNPRPSNFQPSTALDPTAPV